MPLFAHLFGIREWEMDRLTYGGFIRCKKFADDWLKTRRTFADV